MTYFGYVAIVVITYVVLSFIVTGFCRVSEDL